MLFRSLFERLDVPAGTGAGLVELATMGVERSAADLRGGNHDIVAALVQQADAREMSLSEEHTHHATADEADAAAAWRHDGGG